MTKAQMKQKIFIDSLGKALSVEELNLPLGFESDPASTEAERQQQLKMPFNSFKKLARKEGFIVY